MSIEGIAILVLLFIFIVGAIFPINVGVLGIAAAFIVGCLLSDLSLVEVFREFPIALLVFMLGIFYLFSVIQLSGVVDSIADWGLKRVKGHAAFIPWLFFALSFVLASVGGFGLAILSMLAPVALKIADKLNISQLMISILIIMGLQAGSFSPLNIFGVIVNGGMEANGFEHSPSLLLVNSLIYFSFISLLTFLLLGGLRLFKVQSKATAYVSAAIEVTNEELRTEKRLTKDTFYKGLCLASIPILGILTMGLNINFGMAAMLVGIVLSLFTPRKRVRILTVMPWKIILLVTGIVTYVGVMEQVGVMEYVAGLISKMGSPAFAALALSYVSGFVSAFASTTGILASAIPMAESILTASEIQTINVISVIAVSSSVVDLSPFSTAGATFLANVQNLKEKVFFKQLLLTSCILIAFGPGLAWLLFIGIGII